MGYALSLIHISASDADIQVAVLGNSYKMKENDPVISVGRINGSTGQTKLGNITQITDESSVDNTFEMMSIDIIPSYGDYCYISVSYTHLAL